MVAKLIVGKEKGRLDKIQELLEISGVKNPHPDLLYYSGGSKLGIEEARKMKEHFSLKPYQAKGRVIVLEDASSLTIEAQNALLKILEELPENGLFILAADSDSNLLPTVLSRCEIVILNPKGEGSLDSFQNKSGDSYATLQNDIEKLLSITVRERFEYIEKLKEKDEFFHSLLDYFHKKLPANFEFTKELLQAELWQKQNVNMRAILEYLMLVMPKY